MAPRRPAPLRNGVVERSLCSVSHPDDLRPDERDIVGQWLDVGSRIEEDAVAARIRWLVTARLERCAERPDGTASLHRDPADGRLWELTRPWADAPHGGPPRLTVVALEDARARWGDAVEPGT